jgi:hypothetical protein
MSNLIEIVLLSFIVVTLATEFQLKCEFVEMGLTDYDYSTLDIFPKDKKIASIKGKHIKSLTNKKVNKFSIPKESETNFVASGVCKYFTGLKQIEILGKNIKEILRQDFVDCVNVRTLQITGTQIFWLPEDSFNHLVNLDTLILSENQLKLKYLPMNLISLNKNLKTFAAKTNKIEIVDLRFGESVAVVNFVCNKCVNDFVIG